MRGHGESDRILLKELTKLCRKCSTPCQLAIIIFIETISFVLVASVIMRYFVTKGEIVESLE